LIGFLAHFFKPFLLITHPSLESPFPEDSFTLQPLFGAVSAVDVVGQVDFLEDGRVAVEREKKEVQSAPSLQLC
jgi:hypothetical protein